MSETKSSFFGEESKEEVKSIETVTKTEAERLAEAELKAQHAQEFADKQAGRAARFEKKYKELRDQKNKAGEATVEDDPELAEEERAQKQVKEMVTLTLEEQKRKEFEEGWDKKAAFELEARTDNEEERKEILKMAKNMGIADPLIAIEAAVAAYDRKQVVEQSGNSMPSFSHANIYDSPTKNPKAVSSSTVELGKTMGHSEADLKSKNKNSIDLRSWGRR